MSLIAAARTCTLQKLKISVGHANKSTIPQIRAPSSKNVLSYNTTLLQFAGTSALIHAPVLITTYSAKPMNNTSSEVATWV